MTNNTSNTTPHVVPATNRELAIAIGEVEVTPELDSAITFVRENCEVTNADDESIDMVNITLAAFIADDDIVESFEQHLGARYGGF